MFHVENWLFRLGLEVLFRTPLNVVRHASFGSITGHLGFPFEL
jgi:hypothetical protein